MSGFYNEKVDPPRFQPERRKLVLKTIKEENPDILTICEASYPKENIYSKVRRDYKKIFKFPYSYVAAYKDRGGIAIFSKFPFNIEDYAYGLNPLVRANIKAKNKKFSLDLVHPFPTLKEEEKARFMKHILSSRKKGAYILMGDFNAISPEDRYDKKIMLRGFSRFDPNAEYVVKSFLGRKAIKEVLDSGLKDTFKFTKKPWHCTVPTDLLNTNKDSGTRLDFIFCSKAFKVKDAEIIVNESTNKASDHYPITAILII